MITVQRVLLDNIWRLIWSSQAETACRTSSTGQSLMDFLTNLYAVETGLALSQQYFNARLSPDTSHEGP